jgi:hypothetical protein
MERYNLSIPRKYTSNGEEKTAWDNVGVMFKRDKGGYSIKLSMFPELSIFAFPPKAKEEHKGGLSPVDDSDFPL